MTGKNFVGSRPTWNGTQLSILDDPHANTYLTSIDVTIPANAQVIYEDYLELTASFVYELAINAVLVIGDFATPLSAYNQNYNTFITIADEIVPPNSEIIFSDFYELSSSFVTEVGVGSLIQIG